MPAYKTVATLAEDETLTLQQLPFRAGEEVEVIVFPRSTAPNISPTFPLRGKPVKYDDPTQPVAMDDWGTLRGPA